MVAETSFESTYSYPACNDGWCKVHQALRSEMSLVLSATKALRAHAEAGKALEDWQLACFRETFWKQFVHNLHKHHEHEEEIFFPWMAGRIEMPQRVTDDHTTIVNELEQLDQLVSQLSTANSPADNLAPLVEFQTRFAKWQIVVSEHFKEEEDELLPLLRQKFSSKEYNVEVMKMVKKMGRFECPSVLAWMDDDAARKAWMTQEKMPWFVQSLIMLPRTHEYNDKFLAPAQAVVDGVPPPAKRKGFFSFLSK